MAVAAMALCLRSLTVAAIQMSLYEVCTPATAETREMAACDTTEIFLVSLSALLRFSGLRVGNGDSTGGVSNPTPSDPQTVEAADRRPSRRLISFDVGFASRYRLDQAVFLSTLGNCNPDEHHGGNKNTDPEKRSYPC